jgi:hypothetical protein
MTIQENSAGFAVSERIVRPLSQALQSKRESRVPVQRILLVRGHGSNVEHWAFWFKCGTAPGPPFVLQMDSPITQPIADMFFFQVRC